MTLGGYQLVHDRPPAFGGSDDQAYSCAPLIDDTPNDRGLYGAAILFVRWSTSGDRPVGHLETDYLAWGGTPKEAEERLGALSLFDVKAALEEAIERARDR